MYEVSSETSSQRLKTAQAVDMSAIWSEKAGADKYVLKETLSLTELGDVLGLYSRQPQVSIKQHPEWDDVATINGDVRYFLYYREKTLLAYSIIRFPNAKFGMIEFGPVAENKEAALKALRMIVNSVKLSLSPMYLSVQLPWQIGKSSEFVESRIKTEFKIKTFADKRNWGSSLIDTAIPDEELFKEFSTNHRRSVKKAKKLGLTARVCTEEHEIEAFNRIYVDMYSSRGTYVDAETNLEDYRKLLKFFERTGNGFFYGVFDGDEMIGGMIILKQGDSGFYHHSGSDPNRRNMPIQHLGIFTVLGVLREKGIRFFDFGGYNHMVDKTDQVYNINRFKDGFTKNYAFYPKIIYFEFVPNAVQKLERIQKFKDLIKKFIGR